MSDTSLSDCRICALYYYIPLTLIQHSETHSDFLVYGKGQEIGITRTRVSHRSAISWERYTICNTEMIYTSQHCSEG